MNRAYNIFLKAFAAKFMVLGCLILGSYTQVAAAPQRSDMLGGTFTNLMTGPIALLVTDKGEVCSGVLVGSREVLTSAHCIYGAGAVEVLVGGETHTGGEVLYASGFRPGLPILKNAPHDIGIVVLKFDVVRTKPMAILSNRTLQVGDKVTVMGFGLNEVSDQYQSINDFYRGGKYTDFIINRFFPGVFEGVAHQSRAVVCSGDSGGPAIIDVNGVAVVVGISTYSETKTDPFGRCVGSYMSNSGFTDLQGEAASAFLASVPTISRYRYEPPPPPPTPTATPAVTVNLASVIPALPAIGRSGRDIVVSVPTLPGTQIRIYLRGRKNSRVGGRTKITSVQKSVVSATTVTNVKVPVGLKRGKVSYRYESLTEPGVNTPESLPVGM